MRNILRRVARAIHVVIWDPEVQRSAKGVAALVIIRLAIALGASTQVIDILQQILGA